MDDGLKAGCTVCLAVTFLYSAASLISLIALANDTGWESVDPFFGVLITLGAFAFVPASCVMIVQFIAWIASRD
jgi:hypothetical protein